MPVSARLSGLGLPHLRLTAGKEPSVHLRERLGNTLERLIELRLPLPFDLRDRLEQRRSGLREIVELHAQELLALRDLVALGLGIEIDVGLQPRELVAQSRKLVDDSNRARPGSGSRRRRTLRSVAGFCANCETSIPSSASICARRVRWRSPPAAASRSSCSASRSSDSTRACPVTNSSRSCAPVRAVASSATTPRRRPSRCACAPRVSSISDAISASMRSRAEPARARS